MNRFWPYLKSFFQEVDIANYSVNFFPAPKVQYRNGRVELNGKRVNYSDGVLNDFFKYAFQKEGLPESWMQKVLILGFGVGNVANLLIRAKPDLRIKGVEISYELKTIAEKHFGFKGDSFNGRVFWDMLQKLDI